MLRKINPIKTAKVNAMMPCITRVAKQKSQKILENPRKSQEILGNSK